MPSASTVSGVIRPSDLLYAYGPSATVALAHWDLMIVYPIFAALHMQALVLHDDIGREAETNIC